jgi:hypothetical protein
MKKINWREAVQDSLLAAHNNLVDPDATRTESISLEKEMVSSALNGPPVSAGVGSKHKLVVSRLRRTAVRKEAAAIGPTIHHLNAEAAMKEAALNGIRLTVDGSELVSKAKDGYSDPTPDLVGKLEKHSYH